jgi:molybdate transport system regulatory protein
MFNTCPAHGGHNMKVVYKIWLENDGKAFGEGPYRLLKLIEKTGSINRAAADMEMSYRKAWKILKMVEEKLGFELIERKIGGADGGGSQITDRGRDILRNYEGFREEVKTSMEMIYKKYFG